MEDKQQWFEKYSKAPLTEAEKAYLNENKEILLGDETFLGTPAFGTGGMRQIAGPGSNRLNRFTIVKLNLAIAQCINKGLVIIGYDSRLTSLEFATISYHALLSAGYTVKVFKRPTPTPMISFAVRELQAVAGIVITASHNPKEYNGFKVYSNNGGQIVSPLDSEIQAAFDAIAFSDLNSEQFSSNEISKEDLIEEEIMSSYLKRLQQESFVTNATAENKKDLKILYSPLHGTGGWAFKQTFKELGFNNLHILESQANPDGNFTNTTGLNPEEKIAFKGLLAEGKKIGADVLIATDPDADRVGAAILTQGEYQFLSGNQIGSLLVANVVKNVSKEIENPYICKTIVTTELQKKIAEMHNVRCVETLTGFKFIAEQIEKDHKNYIFGGEESYGYLPIPWVRDKDSISSAIALCELANKGNLIEALDELYCQHGLYLEELINIDLKSQPASFMQSILDKIQKPEKIATTLGNRKVIDILNVQKNAPAAKTERVKLLQESLPNAIVAQFWLEPEGRVTIRPSGTEPKIKIYISLMSDKKATKENLPSLKKQLQEEITAIADDFSDKLGLTHA